MVDLSIKIGTVEFKNPVMVASGTFGYASEFCDFFDPSVLGAVVTKTITEDFRPGNPPSRIVETTGGMLNSIGLPNSGVEPFIREKMPFLRKVKTRLIVNIAGKTGDEFARVVEKLEPVDGIDGYELNYSCPNVKEGGLSFSADAAVAEKVTANARKKTRRLLITKLTPNVTSIGDVGKAVENGGADAISAINTVVGMAIDLRKKKPRLSTITGGLSGAAIKPIAMAKVYELLTRTTLPLIAIGGITDTTDALEFLLLGACAVQIGTQNFVNPAIGQNVVEGIGDYCRENHIHHISDFTGSLKI
jgi:dihydroorotate dehydrogenase (NAD+) catalytic subunit